MANRPTRSSDHPPPVLRGIVSLVDAGPWSVDLITVAGLERLRLADAVFLDAGVNPEFLLECRHDVCVISAEDNSGEIVAHARAGEKVVVLYPESRAQPNVSHPLAQRLCAEGLPFEIIQGGRTSPDLPGDDDSSSPPSFTVTEAQPLRSRRIVNTRPFEHGRALTRLLTAAGAEVITLPCLHFAQPLDLEPLRRLGDDMQNVDGVILSSIRGVDVFLDALCANGHDLRVLAGCIVAVIGDSTASRCLERGIRPDILPDAARSEGLVSRLRHDNKLQLRWLHARANQGRSLLRDAIIGARGSYTLLESYRIERSTIPPALLQSLAISDQGDGGFDGLSFSSGATAQFFLEHMNEMYGKSAARSMISDAKVVVLGPVTQKAVLRLGIAVDAVATDTHDHAILTAFSELFQTP